MKVPFTHKHKTSSDAIRNSFALRHKKNCFIHVLSIISIYVWITFKLPPDLYQQCEPLQ